ncbi:hypothetical protein [Rubrobacter calidifluminis]|uniref:hypothetical protein n=1 Tax=Rubrobacter calidifluminis TaxID=1392640 RepID=UPI00235FBC36|nr:hypothetical protein [Rubrobacter calidifluminis]
MQVYSNFRESEVLVELRDFLAWNLELEPGPEELAEALGADVFAVEAALEALVLDGELLA